MGQGATSHLADRTDLWRLLVTLTERKAHNLARDERRLKGGGVVVPCGCCVRGLTTPGGAGRLSPATQSLDSCPYTCALRPCSRVSPWGRLGAGYALPAYNAVRWPAYTSR